jgi:serine/threonine-protein kinase RsbW
MEWQAGHRPSAAVPAAVDEAGRVILTLSLPLERLSVPVVRHLVRATLHEAGASPDDIVVIELAVSEACSNAVQHAGRGDEYQVSLALSPDGCTVRISDEGVGFDAAGEGPAVVDRVQDAETGRGLAIIRALVDQVRVDSRPGGGTVVYLAKHLDFDEGAPAHRLILSVTHPAANEPSRERAAPPPG